MHDNNPIIMYMLGKEEIFHQGGTDKDAVRLCHAAEWKNWNIIKCVYLKFSVHYWQKLAADKQNCENWNHDTMEIWSSQWMPMKTFSGD